MYLQKDTHKMVRTHIRKVKSAFLRKKNGKVKSSFPRVPPWDQCGKGGGIGNDVEKKFFLNLSLSFIIVKSKMEWLKKLIHIVLYEYNILNERDGFIYFLES